ncbi:MFS general substrate transporter, partial [Conidiobolus coronatus NRRL 28638]
MSIVSSFIYFIVRDYIAENPNRVGYYVGTIASSFALSETLTSIGWGYLSDRVGRKPCLILGLLGSSLGMGLFGLSKSLGWAIATRSLHGIFNGDVSVIKTMVGELTDITNRPLAFSYLPIMKAIGSILGGLMGAALTNPVKNYPNWFAKDSIWDQYPYFLPCLFAAFTNILTAVLTYFCLDETLKTGQFYSSSSNSSDIETPQPNTANEESTALLQGNNQQPEQKSIFGLNITKDSERIMLSFMLLSLTSIMYNQLIVIWSATSIEKGGLNFNVKDIGKALSAPSFAILVFQLLIYPKLINLFGTLKLYRNLFPFYTLVFFLIPQINSIAKTDNLSLMW